MNPDPNDPRPLTAEELLALPVRELTIAQLIEALKVINALPAPAAVGV